MSNEYVLYGLDKYNSVVNHILNALNAQENELELRLLLTEGLLNAFEHGNAKDAEKPIYLEYETDGSSIVFTIKDCGEGLKKLNILEEISDEDILKENGRGLFLINSIADEVDFAGNTLRITKALKREIKRED